MKRYIGKTALVTGASSGMGAAISQMLVENGMIVVGAARRLEILEAQSVDWSQMPGKFVPYQCDLTKDEEVEGMMADISRKGNLAVCVNNAGKLGDFSLIDGNTKEWREMLDLNVVSHCLVIKLAIKIMEENNTDGHIINICSMASHIVCEPGWSHFYSGTKSAFRSITEGFRLELKERKSAIRITSINPGLTNTNIFRSHSEEEVIRNVIGKIEPSDIAVTVCNILSTNPRVEINDIQLTPTCLSEKKN